MTHDHLTDHIEGMARKEREEIQPWSMAIKVIFIDLIGKDEAEAGDSISLSFQPLIKPY